MEFLGL